MGGSLGIICCFILGALCAWLGWVPEYLLGHEATVYVLYVLMLLVGCGSAAAIAGIFKAPIAGILFTLEVLMIDMTTTSVLPLLISSITAVTVSYIFTGYSAEFSFVQTETFQAARIPYVIFLGVFCGFVSLYFTRVMTRMEDIFRKIGTPWKKFFFGSAVLSLSIFLLPPLYGEGYGSITSLLNDNLKQLAEGSFFYTENDNMWVMIPACTWVASRASSLPMCSTTRAFCPWSCRTRTLP